MFCEGNYSSGTLKCQEDFEAFFLFSQKGCVYIIKSDKNDGSGHLVAPF
jgi:hypothetical protein